MEPCAVPRTGQAYLSAMLDAIDCHAQTIGASGYHALAAPGSAASAVLTIVLTLFIAVIGLRLLMGERLNGGDLIVVALKLGIVLLLASSWPAYRIIAYDVTLRAPAEIAADVGGASGLAGSDGGMTARLQGVDDAIIAFTVAGSGRFDLASAPGSGPGNLPVGRTPVSDDLAFGMARTAFLGATIASLGLVRLAAGILLALAPLVAGFLLFEGTRWLFMGWARMLIACLLAGILGLIVLAVELTLLEPWLSDVLAQRAARIATPQAPVELLVTALAFTLLLAGTLFIAVRLAFAPPQLLVFRNPWANENRKPVRPVASPQQFVLNSGGADNVSRANRVADALSLQQQRESSGGASETRLPSPLGQNRVPMQTPAGGDSATAPVPLGQVYRRTSPRVSSATAARSARG